MEFFNRILKTFLTFTTAD